MLWVTVCGSSMEPFIRPGDELLVFPQDAAKLHVGDIIVFKNGDSFITHRLVGKRMGPAGLLLEEKPDSGLRVGAIEPERVVGKALAVSRDGLLAWFDTPGSKAVNWILTLIARQTYFVFKAGSAVKRLLTRGGSRPSGDGFTDKLESVFRTIYRPVARGTMIASGMRR